jgi:hypothetical protein
MRAHAGVIPALTAILSLVSSMRGAAQSALTGDTLRIHRAAGRIVVDGDLTDEGWRNATRVDKWYEVNPADNTEPRVGNVGYLTYDDRFFYAAFEFEDPVPHSIRAPLGDHDNIGNGFYDYGGVLLDALNTGRSGTFFVVTPHNIQYDSVTDDQTGEDSAPDFFWESATRITARGWTLEMRIPFSSLRYRNSDPQTWGILLYRNYPREYHYQFFFAKLPRGGNCLVCRENPLVGLEHLPTGGHLVAAPYVSASQGAHPRDDVLGQPLVGDSVKPHAGIDVKVIPAANAAIDIAVKPDFSQVESDTAQIAANERFALFFPEKRPFFLEGVDLFQTPMQAVYTRTIASPRWGGRITGREGAVRYTALVADDAGGGSVVLPGPRESSLASQDFGSTVLVGRAKRETGLSFIGVLATDREAHGGNGHNRVVGPDFEWRPSGADIVTGQWLYSDTRTPNRPDLADEWTGQGFTGSAGILVWRHNTTHLDWYGLYRDVTDRFRADSGFLPQVGYREAFGGGGWTFRPTGFVTRLRPFINVDRQVDRAGAVISRQVEPGFGMDSRWNGFMQFRFIDERIRASDRVIGRRQFGYIAQFSPSRAVSQVGINGTAGEEIDFANSRPGRGATINLTASLHAGDHLELALVQNQRWLNVDDAAAIGRRLVTARVSRVKSTYTFTARMFIRSIAQYVWTVRDPSLYLSDVASRAGDFSGSALFAYKLNWQSVMFIGWGDDRQLSDEHRLEKLDRQFFVKVSYAFQR